MEPNKFYLLNYFFLDLKFAFQFLIETFYNENLKTVKYNDDFETQVMIFSRTNEHDIHQLCHVLRPIPFDKIFKLLVKIFKLLVKRFKHH